MRKIHSALGVALVVAGLSFAGMCHAQSGSYCDNGGGSCRPAGPEDGCATTTVVANWQVRIWTWLAQQLPARPSGWGMGLVAYRRSDPATAFRGKR
jgi:hypothetical protein